MTKLHGRMAIGLLLLSTCPPGSPAVAATKAPAAKPAAQKPASSTPATPSAIEPEAMAALEKSRAYLRTLTSSELRAEMTGDEVQDDGLKLEFMMRARYLWRGPDKLFIDWSSDRIVRRLYFNGSTVTLLAPRTGYYAQVQQPGTVSNVLIHAAVDYGIIFPLPDILLWATKGDDPVDIKAAFKVGYARIAGVDTDQYVFRQSDVDWQVWIQRGDQPLPRKIVITTLDDPVQPKLSALLQWNVNPQIPDATFDFTPPPGTASIGLVKLNAAEPRK